MELSQVIRERHSCRTYLPSPVTDEQIKQIVEAGRLAPSSKNAQQWKFVCIKTETESHDIALMLENFYLKNKNNPELSMGASSVYATGKTLEQCPAIILVFTDCERINRTKVEDISAILSIGAAVENMMLTATDMGLGCLWIADTIYVHQELADYILDKLKGTKYENFIDKSNRLICSMAVGEMGEPRHITSRKNLDDILAIINK